jgi:hypothetical protein
MDFTNILGFCLRSSRIGVDFSPRRIVRLRIVSRHGRRRRGLLSITSKIESVAAGVLIRQVSNAGGGDQ